MRAIGDFEGVWLLSRRIDDRRADAKGQFEGRAVLSRDGAGLTYDETGLLTFGAAAPLTATRRYLWRPDGGLVAVFFADGRPFHSFDPADTAPEAHHPCAPDTYRVRYDFARWPEWSADWQVSGPRKEYRMRSSYRRA